MLVIILLACLFEVGSIDLKDSNSASEFKNRRNWLICNQQDTLLYRGQCVHCISAGLQNSDRNSSKLLQLIGLDVIHHFPPNNDARLAFRRKALLKPATTGFQKPLKRNSVFEETSAFYDCPGNVETFQKKSVEIGAIDLNGRELNVVTIQRHPFSKVIENGTAYSGVIFEILEALQRKYNFSMNIFTPPDGNWGSKSKNGSWNGMIELLIQKKAELGAASFSVTLDRAQVVDFTFAIHREPTGILIPAPEEGEKLTVLIRPLSREVWLSLFVTIGVTAPTFYAFHVCSVSITGDKTVKLKTFVTTMSEICLFITGSMVQESVISPVNKTTRFLIGIWWMITLVLANTYVAFLVSYLAVPKLHNIVNSLEELSQQSQIKWTFRKGTVHQTLFQSESSNGVFKAIGDGVSVDQLVTSDYDGVLRVLNGKYAFIKEHSYLDVALGQDFEEHHKCRLTLTKESFFTVGIAIAVQKDSKFLSLLDFEISNAVATGLMEKWKSLHWAKHLWCADAASYIIETRPRSRKLNFDDVSGAYFLLTSGLTFALIAFLLEQILGCGKHVHNTIMRQPTPRSAPKPLWVTMK